MTQPGDTILQALERSDRAAVDALLPLLYDELRAMAAKHLASSPRADTLQPTSLVHDVYIRLSQGKELRFESVAHFKALCAKVMRELLVDHARRHAADKRGGDRRRVTLATDVLDDTGRRPIDVLDLDEVISKLHALDERKARIVELRFFAGLTNEQIATVLNTARSTVAEDWRFARAWLAQQLLGRTDAATTPRQ